MAPSQGFEKYPGLSENATFFFKTLFILLNLLILPNGKKEKSASLWSINCFGKN